MELSVAPDETYESETTAPVFGTRLSPRHLNRSGQRALQPEDHPAFHQI